MRKVKASIAFAVCGFLISFVFGLFSHTAFGFVLLKALIFAVIFAVLGFCISFIYDKFLDDSAGENSSDSSDLSSSAPKSEVQKGQIVDFTIRDEELPRGDSSNHFVVNDNRQMLNNNDTMQKKEPSISSDDKVENTPPQDNGFVPLRNFETVTNLSSKEAVSPSDAQSPQTIIKAAPEDTNLESDIDVLPDMENLDFGNKGSESSAGEDASTDSDTSDFTGSFSSSGSKKTLEDVGIQDAALMAKAISSALSNDDES